MLGITNKYQTIYYSIIQHRRKNVLTDGEKHHIVPRSLGGTNDDGNLIIVSSREHFILHRLLPKFLEGNDKYKMMWALHRMSFSKRYDEFITSRQYEALRKEWSIYLTDHHPSKQESWRQIISIVVFKHWENNSERRQKTSDRMKQLWAKGKLKARSGVENPMYGKEPYNKGKKYPGTGLSGAKNPAAGIYLITKPDKSTEQIECLREYCNLNNLTYACMLRVVQGKNKQHRGYTVKRLDERRVIRCA